MLETTDDQGFTVINLLACSGKAQLLNQLLAAASRIPGPDALAVTTAAIEAPSNKPTWAPTRNRRPVKPVAHVGGEPVYLQQHLQLQDPPGRVRLFAGTTPIECAAAQGHTDTIKLLVQSGARQGRVFELAKAFGFESQLHDAIRSAHAEGCWATPNVCLPTETEACAAGARRHGGQEPRAGGERQPLQSSRAGGAAVAAAADRACGGIGQPLCIPHDGQDVDGGLLKEPRLGAARASWGVYASRMPDTANGATVSAKEGSDGGAQDLLGIAALVLLTGMLLLPLWSTLWIFWRRSMRRAAMLRRPVRRIKQAMPQGQGQIGAPLASCGSSGGTSVPVVASRAPSNESEEPPAPPPATPCQPSVHISTATPRRLRQQAALQPGGNSNGDGGGGDGGANGGNHASSERRRRHSHPTASNAARQTTKPSKLLTSPAGRHTSAAAPGQGGLGPLASDDDQQEAPPADAEEGAAVSELQGLQQRSMNGSTDLDEADAGAASALPWASATQQQLQQQDQEQQQQQQPAFVVPTIELPDSLRCTPVPPSPPSAPGLAEAGGARSHLDGPSPSGSDQWTSAEGGYLEGGLVKALLAKARTPQSAPASATSTNDAVPAAAPQQQQQKPQQQKQASPPPKHALAQSQPKSQAASTPGSGRRAPSRASSSGSSTSGVMVAQMARSPSDGEASAVTRAVDAASQGAPAAAGVRAPASAAEPLHSSSPAPALAAPAPAARPRLAPRPQLRG